MKKLIFEKFDAFASNKSTGNPAAGVRLNDNIELTDNEMLQLAKEMKGFVSEVAYISKIKDNSFKLKYYSAEREVEFCGHATIGIMYNTIKNDDQLIKKEIVYIETNKGQLPVYNRINDEDCVYIGAPIATVKPCPIPPMEIFEEFKLNVQDLDIRYPFQIVNAGLETLILPVSNLEVILNLKPDLEELNQFCKKYSIDIIAPFTTETSQEGSFVRSRVFAPTFGYLEDPATGSGNAAIGQYLLEQRFWNGEPITIEQNSECDTPNFVKLKTQQVVDRTQILFGGKAVTKIRGEYFL